jgi:hypothetical protein
MYLFNNKAAILESGGIYSTDQIKERIKNAKDINEVNEPLFHYGTQIDKILQERLREVVYNGGSSIRLMLFCVIFAWMAKVGYGMYDGYGSFLSILWKESKWTAPILFVFFSFFAFFKFSAINLQAIIMIREALLGMSLCYDRLYTDPTMRERLLAHTLVENQQKMVQDKGYLKAHMETLLEGLPVTRLFAPGAVENIGKLVGEYMDYILPQFNSVEHFEANYKKATTVGA